MLKQTIKSALLTSVIIAIIFGIITFSYVDNYLMAYTYVSTEINPSVAFELNKQNTVLKALAINEDAKELDLSSMEGESFVDAIEVFISQADKHEFIKDDASMYITAVQLKDDLDTFDALKNSVFDSNGLKRISKRMNIGFAVSSVEKLELSQKSGVSLSSFLDSTAYLSVTGLNSAKVFAGREYILFKTEDAIPDSISDELKLRIDSFLCKIEEKQRDYEPVEPNFVLEINARMNNSKADYYEIYHDVIIYWDEFNDAINQGEILPKHTSSDLINLEPTSVFILDNDSINQYSPTSAYVAPSSAHKAVDINVRDMVDYSDMSHGQAVDDFFYINQKRTSDEKINMFKSKTHLDLEDETFNEAGYSN